MVFSPPVASDSSLSGAHLSCSPSQYSQARGGLRGSTPTPSMVHCMVNTRVCELRSSPYPRYSALFSAGVSWKMGVRMSGFLSADITSVNALSSGVIRACVSVGRRIVKSRLVAKAIASWVSVRTVDTSVPRGIVTGSGCGVESRKVTSTVAGLGGSRRIPIRSRNFM